MHIAGRRIWIGERHYFTAEISGNHSGDIDQAVEFRKAMAFDADTSGRSVVRVAVPDIALGAALEFAMISDGIG